MDINRYNYEEFFLLYIDNELSSAERQTVEGFVEQNPDLGEELLMLQQSTLKPDKDVIFRNKNVLIQFASGEQFINFNNYQELFILYADDELNNAEKSIVEQFVYDHPQ